MKYKNIVFDFGNVIGTFNGREIIRSFVTDETDVDYLCDLIYAHWAELDSGAIDYQEYRNEILRTIPERLYDPVDLFFREWPGCAKPLPQTLAFVRVLLCRLYEGSRDLEAFRRDPVLCSDPHGKTGSGNLRIFLPQI